MGWDGVCDEVWMLSTCVNVVLAEHERLSSCRIFRSAALRASPIPAVMNLYRERSLPRKCKVWNKAPGLADS